MQAGPSKILFGLYALANRSPHLNFHTSACALKGGPRPKARAFKAKPPPNPQRAPARKRLVKSLKPEGKTGTYEVAPRERAGSRHKGPSNDGTRTNKASERRTPPSYEGRASARDDVSRGDRGATFENKQTSPRRRNESAEASAPRQDKGATFERGPPRREEKRFEREDAPHKDRLTYEEYKKAHAPRRRGVDFGLKGSAARRPRFKPEWGSREVTPRKEDNYFARSEPPRNPKPPPSPPLPHEFETPEIEPLKTLPSRFTSPPLMEGLLQSVHDVLGPDARPSPVQSLALKHLFTPPPHVRTTEYEEHDTPPTVTWKQHLLAAETGSGKSMAYLLPMLQHLKLTENNPTPLPYIRSPAHTFPLNPRGLILAPTHELARQLSSFAKALLHHMRLRVLCVSRANTPSSSRGRSTARQLKRELDETGFGVSGVGLHASRPADVVVGTTNKVLEMVRGLGWNRATKIEQDWDEDRKERARRWVPGPQEMGLAGIEWVVIDEADVLFDRDFELSTRLLLAEIAYARGYTHPSFAALNASSGPPVPPPSTPVAYPFHLTLTSATIPASLANYLSVAHPKLARLASPRLHRLPSALSTEHHDWTSGNRNADIEKRLLRVWADDAQGQTKTRSKVLVFCNKSTKVDDLGLYLKEKGIPNVALTSEGAARARGSNRHLAGFLKAADDTPRKNSSPSRETREPSKLQPLSPADSGTSHTKPVAETPPSDPHVLITTSLLSRGLDFSPQIQHVFLVDSPRNMVDFLHRAGRVGRAGNAGRVVIFGKPKGRGADETKDVRRRIGAVAH